MYIGSTMRLEVDLPDDVRERANEYAREEGIRMPRAYAELIEKGLDA